MTIRVVPLGAGQDVGRSCILLSLGGKNIMLDCGMHMGYQDARRFPDFDYISRTGQFTDIIDCVIISHFHLDHCGALPYFTEVCGYDGPIYATYPTKAIMPVLLEDMRKVMTGHRAGPAPFTSADIAACMDKVIPIDLMQTHPVDDELAIRVYYAGHVLGAGMFHLQVGHESVVYTGDYNMTPDRHLGAAWIDQCRPDLLITESTYATMIRSSKRARERDFLQKIHECVAQGGKVLVPVFALGRAQELCILVEDYWARMDMDCPVFFSAGLTERANAYYKLFIGWTNEKIKTSFVDHNVFDFRYIKPWDASLVSHAGPMLLFATPGMLHGGISLEVFAQWCGDPKNMIILPGYCAVGTAGAKVLSGAREIQIDPRQTVTVNMAVANLSFSAHADAKGILQLITMCRPRHVMLVHGERTKMPVLKERIERELGIPCHTPANGTAVHLDTAPRVPVRIDRGAVAVVVAERG
ncbi:hypothetical protein CXG81DRAFT_29076 [Caulochytrium protostelioides]|uniref:Metallo-hydrolase/oxidoreductase n=1 Tax=Caulochytrium protostelioides TaxID=1555241 RepID=A0A4P9XG62_9FUNG|nr:hypothetical protein CXG81DRAFT_29076 [Caulochytrium protostelioides]|eukprot:RKP04221.1 hypothetical protein CXG81DRAFT_29076 [Caulochytrium protostelioides]